MRKQALLVLLLLACLSLQLSAEALDCGESRELGKLAAMEGYRAWGWFWTGIGAGLLEAALFASIEGRAAAMVVAVALTPAMIIPAMILPPRTQIFPPSFDLDLECYRTGYKRTTTWRNYGAFVLGEVAVLFLFIPVAGMLNLFAT